MATGNVLRHRSPATFRDRTFLAQPVPFKPGHTFYNSPGTYMFPRLFRR
jgi:hypothetical protein